MAKETGVLQELDAFLRVVLELGPHRRVVYDVLDLYGAQVTSP
jgi:hypothetical protein